MPPKSLGELQEMVMLVIGNLKENAYGLAIKDYFDEQLNRPNSISAIHATLQRLEKKGMVTSAYDNSSDHDRGGRPKLVFKLTAYGAKELAMNRELRNELWNGMHGLSLNQG